MPKRMSQPYGLQVVHESFAEFFLYVVSLFRNFVYPMVSELSRIGIRLAYADLIAFGHEIVSPVREVGVWF